MSQDERRLFPSPEDEEHLRGNSREIIAPRSDSEPQRTPSRESGWHAVVLPFDPRWGFGVRLKSRDESCYFLVRRTRSTCEGTLERSSRGVLTLNLSGHLLESPVVAPWFFPSTRAGASLARGLFPSVDRRWMGGSASAGWDRSKWQLSLFLRNTHVQNYFVTRFTFRMCLCFY